MRLLIAEDDLDLAEALTVFLEKNQYTVEAVHDGRTALDYAGTGGYDAIILDIMMPKLDGLQVLTRLREGGVSTPVMLLTARGEKDDRVAGFNSGADDYLPKPFAPDELLARVRAMLRRQRTTSLRCSASAAWSWTAGQAPSGAGSGRSGSAPGSSRLWSCSCAPPG